MRLLPMILAILLPVGCSPAAVTVNEARIARPTGPNAALYFVARGTGSDRLIEASTALADRVELHETVIDDDGRARMTLVEAFDLPADGTLVLEPGGKHLMLVDVLRLDLGAEVAVTLVWEQAGEISIQAVVVDPHEAGVP